MDCHFAWSSSEWCCRWQPYKATGKCVSHRQHAFVHDIMTSWPIISIISLEHLRALCHVIGSFVWGSCLVFFRMLTSRSVASPRKTLHNHMRPTNSSGIVHFAKCQCGPHPLHGEARRNRLKIRKRPTLARTAMQRNKPLSPIKSLPHNLNPRIAIHP